MKKANMKEIKQKSIDKINKNKKMALIVGSVIFPPIGTAVLIVDYIKDGKKAKEQEDIKNVDNNINDDSVENENMEEITDNENEHEGS